MSTILIYQAEVMLCMIWATIRRGRSETATKMRFEQQWMFFPAQLLNLNTKTTNITLDPYIKSMLPIQILAKHNCKPVTFLDIRCLLVPQWHLVRAVHRPINLCGQLTLFFSLCTECTTNSLQYAILILLPHTLSSIFWPIVRGIRNPGVRQCLIFCSADS